MEIHNLFISGSRFITELKEDAVNAIDKVVATHPELNHLIVGDANGVDTMIQKIIVGDVTVYATKRGVRNYVDKPDRVLAHVGNSYTGRDMHMTNLCTVHLGFVTDKHPCNGTRANHRRALQQGKTSYLYNVDTQSFE